MEWADDEWQAAYRASQAQETTIIKGLPVTDPGGTTACASWSATRSSEATLRGEGRGTDVVPPRPTVRSPDQTVLEGNWEVKG
jgi:hypothetical protein